MEHYNIREIAVAREKIDKEVHQTAEKSRGVGDWPDSGAVVRRKEQRRLRVEYGKSA